VHSLGSFVFNAVALRRVSGMRARGAVSWRHWDRARPREGLSAFQLAGLSGPSRRRPSTPPARRPTRRSNYRRG
jgi:hypothetical protein